MPALEGNLLGGQVNLDGYALTIDGAVQRTLITPTPEKVAIGEITRDDELILGSWIIEDLRGGLGVERLDPERHRDRYDFATWDLAYEKQGYLLPLHYEVNTGRPASTEPRVIVQWDQRLYVAWDNIIRELVGDVWTPPGEAGYANLDSVATDGISFRMDSSTLWLVLCDGDKYLQFDGTTWTRVTGNGTTIPKAKWLLAWDNKLWTLDVNGKMWWTSDLATWTPTKQIPINPDDILGLDIYFDPENGRPTPHASTREGLWLYEAGTPKWELTRLRYPRHRFGGLGHSQFRDEYFQSRGLHAHRYTGNVVGPAGLDRDHGLPKDYNGHIVALEDCSNWLVAGVNAEDVGGGPTMLDAVGSFAGNTMASVAGRSALFRWTGSAWHTLWASPIAGAGLRCLTYATAQDQTRLWFGVGTNMYYIPMPEGIFNPRELPDHAFQPSGDFYSGWFNKRWTEIPAVLKEIEIALERASLTEFVDIYVGLDLDPGWIYIGRANTDRPDPYPFESSAGAGDGQECTYVRLWLSMQRDPAAPTKSPIFDFAVLKYMLWPDARYAYTFTAVVEPDGDDAHTAAQIEAHFDAVVDGKRFVPFFYRRKDIDPVTRRVKVTRFVGATHPGEDAKGRYTISLTEI